MNKITIEDFLLNYGLYDELTIDIDYLDWLQELKSYPLKLDTYCPNCKERSTFITDGTNKKTIVRGRSSVETNFDPNFNMDIETIQLKHREEFNSFIENNKRFERILYCARDESHLMIYNFLITKNSGEKTLLKIGQYPSLIDLNNKNIKKNMKLISKILSEEKASEYRKAIMLFNYEYGIGAFIYLRRIFESLILNTFKENEESLDIVSDFSYLKMDEKIKVLKKYLPDFLTQNKHLYGIISKGVHELEEKECLEIFNVVKESIELILERLNAIIETNKKEMELEKSLNEINTKYNK